MADDGELKGDGARPLGLKSDSARPLVIFIHHYGGDADTSRRHQRLVSQLGYRHVSFTLGHAPWWFAQVKRVCAAHPGPKIFFSFSFPSYLVARYLAEVGAADARGWICDGGPFADMWECFLNYYTYAWPVPAGWRRRLVATLGYCWLGGFGYEKRVRRWVAALPPSLPILSLRGGADRLVQESHIEAFFGARAVEKLVFPGADHLEGLKVAPTSYRERVADFLARLS